MSYILDALRKSDQQRRRSGVPTLPAALSSTAQPDRPKFLLLGLLGLSLIASGIAIGWLQPWRPESAVEVNASPLSVKSIATAPSARSLAAATARIEPPAIPIAPIVTTAQIPGLKVPSPPARSMASASLPVMPGEISGTDPSDDMSPQKTIIDSDLPLSMAQGLPTISVSVHAYSRKPRDRIVSINDRLLREGDYLSPELKLEQITADGMIFSYRGYRFRRGVH